MFWQAELEGDVLTPHGLVRRHLCQEAALEVGIGPVHVEARSRGAAVRVLALPTTVADVVEAADDDDAAAGGELSDLGDDGLRPLAL